ncbi:hypothetical protein, partial [Schaalia cardiffensis]|uniref:hypothetical protein n=1 Tax=Schaalia cardiffensis TaxID=181487 RepID=UPI0023F278B0
VARSHRYCRAAHQGEDPEERKLSLGAEGFADTGERGRESMQIRGSDEAEEACAHKIGAAKEGESGLWHAPTLVARPPSSHHPLV